MVAGSFVNFLFLAEVVPRDAKARTVLLDNESIYVMTSNGRLKKTD